MLIGKKQIKTRRGYLPDRSVQRYFDELVLQYSSSRHVTEYISPMLPQRLKAKASTNPCLYSFCKRHFKEFVIVYSSMILHFDSCSDEFCGKFIVQDLLLAMLLELLCTSLLAMRICMEMVHEFSYTIKMRNSCVNL